MLYRSEGQRAQFQVFTVARLFYVWRLYRLCRGEQQRREGTAGKRRESPVVSFYFPAFPTQKSARPRKPRSSWKRPGDSRRGKAKISVFLPYCKPVGDGVLQRKARLLSGSAENQSEPPGNEPPGNASPALSPLTLPRYVSEVVLVCPETEGFPCSRDLCIDVLTGQTRLQRS